ncbi:hypothetical protein NNM67_004013 [Shigella sonnei]|nr:hypothetical protein [Shigella sonnei]
MLGGADNPNGELLSYIIGADKFELPTKARQFFGSDSIVRQKYPSKRQTAEYRR